MKYMVVTALVLSWMISYGQKEIKPTANFLISGEVKSSLTVGIPDLKKWKETGVADMVITNHLGEKKSEVKGIRGILLKDILSAIEINAESPKVLSEYYFVCKANDGYTVVFSWNELFNNPIGDGVYVITEHDGVSADHMKDAMLLVSTSDFKTGRRHVKALQSIEVKRAR